jgi:hypothetical protein
MRDDAKYEAAVADLRARGPHANTRWRHRKGGVYVIVFNGITEATLEPCVAYRNPERPADPYWVRPLSEFLDGRFTPEPPTTDDEPVPEDD